MSDKGAGLDSSRLQTRWELDELLKGKAAEDLQPDELERKAHWRWDRGAHYEASLLFDAAGFAPGKEQDPRRAGRGGYPRIHLQAERIAG